MVSMTAVNTDALFARPKSRYKYEHFRSSGQCRLSNVREISHDSSFDKHQNTSLVPFLLIPITPHVGDHFDSPSGHFITDVDNL